MPWNFCDTKDEGEISLFLFQSNLIYHQSLFTFLGKDLLLQKSLGKGEQKRATACLRWHVFTNHSAIADVRFAPRDAIAWLSSCWFCLPLQYKRLWADFATTIALFQRCR